MPDGTSSQDKLFSHSQSGKTLKPLTTHLYVSFPHLAAKATLGQGLLWKSALLICLSLCSLS